MSSRIGGSSRGGFTAIELVMVIGIMLILMAIAVPSILPAIRRGQVNDAVNDLTRCWRQARALAMTTAVPTGATPPHFGVLIEQQPGQRPSVAVVFDSVASGAARVLNNGIDPVVPSTWVATGDPVAEFRFNRSVMLSSTALSGGSTTILIYAQYGTGLPILAQDVNLGRGMVAPPACLGIASAAAAASVVVPDLRVQTLDYETAPTRRGFASNFAIYHAGFCATEEL